MQMYLNYAPYLAASSSDDFPTLGHEFTHGVSNRLVVNSNNHSTLNSYQAGGMGEGWGDFYALEYLVARGYATNTADPGRAHPRPLPRQEPGRHHPHRGHSTAGSARPRPTACSSSPATRAATPTTTSATASSAPRCTTPARRGRRRCGTSARSSATGSRWAIVTEGMRLSADDPSMLDMRDAIIAADEAIYGGAHYDALWAAFADRGIGLLRRLRRRQRRGTGGGLQRAAPAGDADGLDRRHRHRHRGQPAAGRRGQDRRSQRVLRRRRRQRRLRDQRRAVGHLAQGGRDRRRPRARLGARDRHARGHRATFDPELRRDWASASGGASIASFTGPDYSPACGPDGAIDLSPGTGWGSATTADDVAGGAARPIVDPKEIVIELPETITVTGFGVNPRQHLR